MVKGNLQKYFFFQRDHDNLVLFSVLHNTYGDCKNRIGNYTGMLRVWLEDRLQLPRSMDPLPLANYKEFRTEPYRTRLLPQRLP